MRVEVDRQPAIRIGNMVLTGRKKSLKIIFFRKRKCAHKEDGSSKDSIKKIATGSEDEQNERSLHEKRYATDFRHSR
jgi:hypothetical protein